ncbi:hypothetical protein ACOZGK_005169 [Escherichia coli]|nr:hypothetical protein [Escherichia coli]HDI8919906.1 hypothetical protein [Escherichia coli]
MTTCSELKERARFDGMHDASLEVAWQLLMTKSVSTITTEIISGANMSNFSVIIRERYKHAIAKSLLNHLSPDVVSDIIGLSHDEFNQQYKGNLTRQQHLRDIAVSLTDKGFTESSACNIVNLDLMLLPEENWLLYKENYNTGYQDALYKSVWRMHTYEYPTATISCLTKLNNENILNIITGIEVILLAAKKPACKDRTDKIAEMLKIPFSVVKEFIDEQALLNKSNIQGTGS